MLSTSIQCHWRVHRVYQFVFKSKINLNNYWISPYDLPCSTLNLFWRTLDIFMGPLIPLFWTSGNVLPRLQGQIGCQACMLYCLCVRDSSDLPLVQHLLVSWWPALHPSLVDLHTYVCIQKHLWDSKPRKNMPLTDKRTIWVTLTRRFITYSR